MYIYQRGTSKEISNIISTKIPTDVINKAYVFLLEKIDSSSVGTELIKHEQLVIRQLQHQAENIWPNLDLKANNVLDFWYNPDTVADIVIDGNIKDDSEFFDNFVNRPKIGKPLGAGLQTKSKDTKIIHVKLTQDEYDNIVKYQTEYNKIEKTFTDNFNIIISKCNSVRDLIKIFPELDQLLTEEDKTSQAVKAIDALAAVFGDTVVNKKEKKKY